MANFKLDIVTAEKVVYSDDVDMVVAPGVQGQLGILPHHTPLMTTLDAGELRIKKGGEELSLAISGGFLEVRPDHVIVLADAAERADEIDVARAEAAKRRAEERLTAQHVQVADEETARAALARAMARLKVAEKIKRRKRQV